MPYTPKNDLYSLLHEVSTSMVRGPYQGLAVRPGQNKVLKILNSRDSMLQKELQLELGIRAASLSELLKKLEDDDFIVRERTNRGREIRVSITEKGRISALEREMACQERDEVLFGCLDTTERESLMRILNKLLGTWREREEETDGQRRERRWKENAAAQEEEREMERRVLSELQSASRRQGDIGAEAEK